MDTLDQIVSLLEHRDALVESMEYAAPERALAINRFMHKDGVPGSCEGVVGIHRIGDSVAHGSVRAATLAYALDQLGIGQLGPMTEPPPKPTPKPNTATPSVPLRARKKELRQIEHRKRLSNKRRGS